MASEFDLLRKKANQDSVAGQQAKRDALKRRFAQAGQVGSGSMIKQEQMAIDEGNRARDQAMTDIGIAEARQKRADDETAIERAFREKQFQAQQGQADRSFGLQQEQFGFQKDQFGKQFDLQKEGFDLDKRIKEEQLRQSSDEFERQKVADMFNFLKGAGSSSDALIVFTSLFDQTGKIPSVAEINAELERRGLLFKG